MTLNRSNEISLSPGILEYTSVLSPIVSKANVLHVHSM